MLNRKTRYEIIREMIINTDAETIMRLINNPPINYKANYMGTRKYRVWKERIFEIVTRVFVKMNVLQSLHYPNTAYLRIRDIPYKKGNIQ